MEVYNQICKSLGFGVFFVVVNTCLSWDTCEMEVCKFFVLEAEVRTEGLNLGVGSKDDPVFDAHSVMF